VAGVLPTRRPSSEQPGTFDINLLEKPTAKEYTGDISRTRQHDRVTISTKYRETVYVSGRASGTFRRLVDLVQKRAMCGRITKAFAPVRAVYLWIGITGVASSLFS
jgi:hypothetical protein